MTTSILVQPPSMTVTPAAVPCDISIGGANDPTIRSAGWAPATRTLNSLQRVLYCMDGPYEGPLHGVPTTWSWAQHPTVGSAVPPAGMAATTGWGQVYADANATEPAQGTVRVELKNNETYTWSNSQRKWNRVQAVAQDQGGHYYENFSGNLSQPADWRVEPDGGISSAMIPGYNLHFFPQNRGSVSVDVGALFTTVQARLIGANVATARYLLNVGADWWRDLTIGYGDGTNNPGVGQGRFCYLTGAWQAFNFWTGGAYASVTGSWSDAQMTANLPPLDGMGQP